MKKSIKQLVKRYMATTKKVLDDAGFTDLDAKQIKEILAQQIKLHFSKFSRRKQERIKKYILSS